MVVALDNVSLADISDRLLLSNVSWERYEQMIEQVERSGRHFKLTFDRGDLEIELPSQIHEVVAAFIRSMIEAYCIHSKIDLAPFGETTWTRRAVAKGLEADACYYVRNAKLIGSRIDIDLDRDPPPDLAIEVEATRPLLPKLPVYAAVGVSEIWHAKTTGEIQILILENRDYRVAEQSLALVDFSLENLTRFVGMRLEQGHSPALRQFIAELH